LPNLEASTESHNSENIQSLHRGYDTHAVDHIGAFCDC